MVNTVKLDNAILYCSKVAVVLAFKSLITALSSSRAASTHA